MQEVKPTGNEPIFAQPRNREYTQPMTESGGTHVIADDQTQRRNKLEWIPTENAPMIFLLKDILTELRLIRHALTK